MGRPKLENPKQMVAFRLPVAIIDRLRRSGESQAVVIEKALLEYWKNDRRPN